MGYNVYFDNFFSSVSLVVDLLQNGTTSVATTHFDRNGYPKEEINKTSVAGCAREMTHSTTLDNKVHCFVWLDTKPVFFLLTHSLDALCIARLLGHCLVDHS